MAEPLTVAEVREGLRLLGIDVPGDAEPYTAHSCPVCDGLWTLSICQNGNGAHIECTTGCDHAEILGAVRAGLRQMGRQEGGDLVGAATWSQNDRLRTIRTMLGLPELKRVIKHGRMGDAYELELNDGRMVLLGDAATLQNQNRFRARFLPQVRRQARPVERKAWDGLVELIEVAAEERDSVSTEGEEARGWIAGYLRHSSGARLDVGDPDALYAQLGDNERDQPFTDQDGRLYLRLEHLALFVNRYSHSRVTSHDLSLRLGRGLGFTRKQISARRGHDVRKVRYWVSPPGFEVDG